jgi:hypothetical protein
MANFSDNLVPTSLTTTADSDDSSSGSDSSSDWIKKLTKDKGGEKAAPERGQNGSKRAARWKKEKRSRGGQTTGDAASAITDLRLEQKQLTVTKRDFGKDEKKKEEKKDKLRWEVSLAGP